MQIHHWAGGTVQQDAGFVALKDAENCPPILGGGRVLFCIGNGHRNSMPPQPAVQNGHMRLYQIPTEYQLADLLTKSLQRGQIERNLSCLLGYDLGLRRG